MHLVRRLARACKCVSSLSGRLPLAENEEKLSLSERHLRSLDKNKDGVVSPKELYQRLKLNYKRCAKAVAYIFIRSPRTSRGARSSNAAATYFRYYVGEGKEHLYKGLEFAHMIKDDVVSVATGDSLA